MNPKAEQPAGQSTSPKAEQPAGQTMNLKAEQPAGQTMNPKAEQPAGQSTNPKPSQSESPIQSTTPLPNQPDTPASSTVPAQDQNQTFVQFVEAVSGKPATEEIRNLVQGVVGLRRKGEAVELTKSDSSIVLIGSDTEFGASLIRDLSEAKEKLTSKFGPDVGRLVDEFVGVTVTGSHIDVIRDGPEDEDIDLSEKKIKRQLPLKRVRLSKISVDLVQVDAYSTLKNITGIEVIPNVGFEIPIILKEFSRSKNQDGDDVLTFGIRNPLPIFKPLRKLFGIKDIIPFTWTAKRKESKEIGAKEPADHKE